MNASFIALTNNLYMNTSWKWGFPKTFAQKLLSFD